MKAQALVILRDHPLCCSAFGLDTNLQRIFLCRKVLHAPFHKLEDNRNALIFFVTLFFVAIT